MKSLYPRYFTNPRPKRLLKDVNFENDSSSENQRRSKITIRIEKYSSFQCNAECGTLQQVINKNIRRSNETPNVELRSK